MSVKDTQAFKQAVEWYTEPRHAAVQLLLLAEISDTLRRIEQQYLDKVQQDNQAVQSQRELMKILRKWGEDGKPEETV